MFGKVCLFICLIAFVSGADDDASVDERFVKVLSDKSFDRHVKNETLWLVEFYAPWCGHCKSLRPVWADAAKTLSKEQSQMRLAKVDSTANPSLTQRFGIQGYPTIKFFRDGKFKGDYSGGRTEKDILKFSREATKSLLIVMNEKMDIHDVLAEQDITYLLVGVGAGNVPTQKAFEKIADDESVIGKVRFVILPSVETLNTYLKEEEIEPKSVPSSSVVVFNTDEVRFISSQGPNAVKLDQPNIEKFVKENMVPFFPELSPSKNWGLTKQGLKTVLTFVDPSKPESVTYKDMMKKAKRKFEKKLVFGWVDATSAKYLLDPIGITNEDLPTFVVVDISSMTYHKCPHAKTEQEALTYLESVLDNKQPTLNIVEEKKDKKEPAQQQQQGQQQAQQQKDETAEVIKALKSQIEDLKRVSKSQGEQVSSSTVLLFGILIGFVLGLILMSKLQHSPSTSSSSGEKKTPSQDKKKK